MTEIYVGAKNVTADYLKFQGKVQGTTIDGEFTGREKQEYVKAVRALNLPKEQETLFLTLINSKCADRPDADKVYLALYEVLVNFIESDKFGAVRDKRTKAAMVGLAVDVFQRVYQRGYKIKQLPAATVAGETPYSPLSVSDETRAGSEKSPLDLETCTSELSFEVGEVEANDDSPLGGTVMGIGGTEDTGNPRYGKVGELSLGQRKDVWNKRMIQLDLRFSHGVVPNEPGK